MPPHTVQELNGDLNLLAKSNSIFENVGKVQLIPQTFGRLRIVELTIQNGFHPIESLSGSLQAKLGLTLHKETKTKTNKNMTRKMSKSR